jgi:hypothetical protein
MGLFGDDTSYEPPRNAILSNLYYLFPLSPSVLSHCTQPRSIHVLPSGCETNVVGRKTTDAIVVLQSVHTMLCNEVWTINSTQFQPFICYWTVRFFWESWLGRDSGNCSLEATYKELVRLTTALCKKLTETCYQYSHNCSHKISQLCRPRDCISSSFCQCTSSAYNKTASPMEYNMALDITGLRHKPKRNTGL